MEMSVNTDWRSFFYFAFEEAHFPGLLLIHQEVDGLALIAHFPFRIGDFGMDIGQIPHLLSDLRTNRQFRLIGRDGLAKLHIQLNGVAAGLQLASDHPSADLINQGTQDAAMEGVHPSLIMSTWLPATYNVFAILVELKMQSDRIRRTAAEAVVLWTIQPGIDDPLQIPLCLGTKLLLLFHIDESLLGEGRLQFLDVAVEGIAQIFQRIVLFVAKKHVDTRHQNGGILG